MAATGNRQRRALPVLPDARAGLVAPVDSQSKAAALAWRVFSLLCLAAMLHAIRRDWRYWPYTDTHFDRYTRVFQNAAPKTKVTIPIYPDGHEMILLKK